MKLERAVELRKLLMMNDPNALVALVREIDKNNARLATTPSLDRAK